METIVGRNLYRQRVAADGEATRDERDTVIFFHLMAASILYGNHTRSIFKGTGIRCRTRIFAGSRIANPCECMTRQQISLNARNGLGGSVVR